MGDALTVVFGRGGEVFDARFAFEAGGGGASAIGAKAIRVANLRLLAGPALITALFGFLDRVDERLDLTKRIGISARESEVGIRRLRIQPGALAKQADCFVEACPIACGDADQMGVNVCTLRRDVRPR